MDRATWTPSGMSALADRAEKLLDRSQRAVLGIAGAPASGKSTLATAVVGELQRRHRGEVVLVGMDAFHIGHGILLSRGQESIKGAPETFDAHGYATFLAHARQSQQTVYAPEFRRELEESLAHVVEISREVRLVVTEGNYLLLPRPPWDQVRSLLDEAWFVHLEDDERRRRMVARHQHFGHSLADATDRAMGSDEANATLVNSAQNNPDLWVEHAF